MHFYPGGLNVYSLSSACTGGDASPCPQHAAYAAMPLIIPIISGQEQAAAGHTGCSGCAGGDQGDNPHPVPEGAAARAKGARKPCVATALSLFLD